VHLSAVNTVSANIADFEEHACRQHPISKKAIRAPTPGTAVIDQDDEHMLEKLLTPLETTNADVEADERAWRQTNFDALTGLPNRRLFRDRLEQAIMKAHRAENRLALLFLDLDYFKEVNDTLGHGSGDMLLRETARRLRACVRESDTVARLGGDEFFVLLGDLDDTTNVERAATGILRTLAAPFHFGNEELFISASIGIAFYPDDARDIDLLLRNTIQAMSAAKTRGRNRYSYFGRTGDCPGQA
jgi:diguanylate cyclase (GGDEF)-like protein